MTTIASDGKTIAIDTMASSDGERDLLPAMKFAQKQDHFFAMSGPLCFLTPMLKWWLGGATPFDMPKPTDEKGNFLVFGPSCVLRYHLGNPYPDIDTYPTAYGSGGRYASGAMAAGASPAEAVEIACRFDVWSSQPVQVFDVPTKQLDRG